MGASIALVTSGLVAGGILVGTSIAGAQTDGPTQAPTAEMPTDHPTDRGPGDGSSAGPGETLLEGSVADEVETAALKAVPGGTVIRTETDADGSPYEAHVQRSDGTVVTVHVGEGFTVTSTEEGFGPEPSHGDPDRDA